MNNLNKVKELIKNLEKYSFPKDDFNDSEWSIDYQIDLDNRLKEELLGLYTDLRLLNDSLNNHDLITAKCALIYIRIKTLDLSNFFLNIYEDIEKVGWRNDSKLPDIPDGYKIPECYQYPSDK